LHQNQYHIFPSISAGDCFGSSAWRIKPSVDLMPRLRLFGALNLLSHVAVIELQAYNPDEF
jgi:hypothetical protein